jgi:hypothetical protein
MADCVFDLDQQRRFVSLSVNNEGRVLRHFPFSCFHLPKYVNLPAPLLDHALPEMIITRLRYTTPACLLKRHLGSSTLMYQPSDLKSGKESPDIQTL